MNKRVRKQGTLPVSVLKQCFRGFTLGELCIVVLVDKECTNLSFHSHLGCAVVPQCVKSSLVLEY